MNEIKPGLKSNLILAVLVLRFLMNLIYNALSHQQMRKNKKGDFFESSDDKYPDADGGMKGFLIMRFVGSYVNPGQSDIGAQKLIKSHGDHSCYRGHGPTRLITDHLDVIVWSALSTRTSILSKKREYRSWNAQALTKLDFAQNHLKFGGRAVGTNRA